MRNVVFDEESAARIAAAVKWVEQYSLDETQDTEDVLPPDSNPAATVCREVSLVEPTGALTLLAPDDSGEPVQVVSSLSGPVVQSLSGTVVSALSGSVVQSLSGTVVSSLSGSVVQSLSGTVVSSLSGSVVQSLSGTVVTNVTCSNGNLVVTTESLSNLATVGDIGAYASTVNLSSLAVNTDIGAYASTVDLSSLATVADISSYSATVYMVGGTGNRVSVSLSDLASVTTQNISVFQGGNCT